MALGAIALVISLIAYFIGF